MQMKTGEQWQELLHKDSAKFSSSGEVIKFPFISPVWGTEVWRSSDRVQAQDPPDL